MFGECATMLKHMALEVGVRSRRQHRTAVRRHLTKGRRRLAEDGRTALHYLDRDRLDLVGQDRGWLKRPNAIES